MTELLDSQVLSSLLDDRRINLLLPERLMPRSINNQHSWNPYILSVELEKVKSGAIKRAKTIKASLQNTYSAMKTLNYHLFLF